MIRRVLSAGMLIAACAAGPVFGQAVSGTILGTVTDATGAVRVPETRVFPLHEAVEAQRISESRHLRGKLVLKVR